MNWPYAAEQEAPISQLLERFGLWKNSISIMIEYFVGLQQMDQAHIKQISKLSNKLTEMEAQFGSHSQGVFKHWFSYGTSSISALQTADQQLVQLVLKRLETLKGEVKKKISHFKNDIDSYTKRVQKTRSKAAHAMEQHERMLLSRQQTNTLPSSPHATDPWLHERVLNQLLIEMVDQENQYQKSMSALFQEMGVFDAHIVEDLKRILEEFGMLRGSLLSSMQATIQHTTDVAVHVEPTSYFSNMSTLLALDAPSVWKQERKLADFGFQAQDIKVIKTGLLYCQNIIGWWYPVQAVLTATGFFHCFQLGRKHPLIEYFTKQDLSRRDVDESILNENPVGVDLGLKCDYSISLASPRLTLQQKPGQHIFILSQTKRSGIFKHETVKHVEFKCLSEADMIQWMAVLQQAIQGLVQRPPEPLFKSPQAIEENVQSLIKDSSAALITDYPPRRSTEKTSAETIHDNEETFHSSLTRKKTIEGVKREKLMRTLSRRKANSQEFKPTEKTDFSFTNEETILNLAQ